MALNSLNAMSGSYDLNTAKSRLGSALGWGLTDADVSEAQKKFGGDANTQYTDEGLKPVYDYFSSRGQSQLAPSPTPGPSPTPAPAAAPNQGPAPGAFDSSSQVLDYMRQRDAERTQQTAAVTDASRQAMLKLMGDNQQIPTIDDPTLKPQADAYNAQRTRGARDERSALAERAANQGLIQGGQSSGAFDTGMQGIQEKASQDTSSHDAALVGTELQARRGQLMQALQLAEALGARTEASNIQSELAALDAQLRTTGMGIQSDLGRGQLGLGLLGTLLGDQNQKNQLGFNYADLLSRLNRDSLLAGMG